MATNFSAVLQSNCTTDAAFRAWAQFVEDTIVTIGQWQVTADLNQTLPSALLHPTGGGQKKGFRIYSMNDPLQASFPVYVRIDYGSDNSGTGPGMWLTVGKSTDGSGNITNVLYNGTANPANIGGADNANGNSGAAVLNSYASADPSRFAFGMFIGSNSAWSRVFTLERTKDALGHDTIDGLLFIWKTGNAGSDGSTRPVDRTLYILNAVTAQPAIEFGLAFILTGQNPSQTFSPGDIGVGVITHFKAIAQQPGTQMLMLNSNDMSSEGIIRMTLYGQTRTYVNIGATPVSRTKASGFAATETSVKILLRYD